jgi:hypothetical protein
MPLSLQEIRSRAEAKQKVHPHTMRAWDGAEVLFQELDGLQIYEWDKANVDRGNGDMKVLMDTGTAAEHLVKLCMVAEKTDADGNVIPGEYVRVFGDSRTDTLAVRKLCAALQESYMFCLKINRMRRIDDEAAEKNSDPVPSSDSGATSPTAGDAA